METVPVECAKCKCERDHSITITENTPANIIVMARCLTCETSITLPLTAPRGGSRIPLADRIKMALSMGKHRRKIIKG